MKKPYFTLLVSLVLAFGRIATPVLAQVPIMGFSPYTQDFNSLSSNTTTQQSFQNNVSLLGVYAQAVLDGFGAYPQGDTPVPYYGNDGGQHPEANYYSFGTAGSTERAFGGIATTFMVSGYPLVGNGYVAMRFVNKTGRTIENLEVSYAMEQWYNSGKVDKAQVNFDYQLPATTFSGAMQSGTWVNVAALGVAAPSTATVVASKNGNSPANRRVLNSTISNLNLANGKEVVLRWKYALNKDTNGNGLAIDDVTITPQAGSVATDPGAGSSNVFYYAGKGNLDQLSSWASKSNAQPTSFAAANQIYYVTSGQVALPGNFISGTNSKLILGDGSNTSVVSAVMTPDSNPAITIDVANNSTLEITGKTGNLPILGKLSPSSTVYYNITRSDVAITCENFGNLKLNGNSVKTLAHNVSVYGTLSLTGNNILALGVYDLTVLKGGSVTTDGTAYVRTNAGGALRQTVSNNNVAVLFPVGQYTYNPAWLSQVSTATEDVFGISVSDSVFTSYTKTPLNTDSNKGAGKGEKGAGKLLPKSITNVDHTWYISEDELGNSNVTIKLQSELPADMSPAQVMVGHYHNATWDNDTEQKGKSVAVNPTDKVYQFTRTGVTDFSPFSLNAAPPAVLPVELIAFTAKRTSSAVTCTWATATEVNNDYFIVERSLDGLEFRALTKVAGTGSSSVRHDYSWVDSQPASTLAYYRLRQVDKDGTETLSPTVAVNGKSIDLAITVAPNPSAGPIAITFNTSEATPVQGSVMNIAGKEVLRFTQSANVDSRTIALDLSAQPAGMYLLQVQTPQGLQTLRVVKQ